MSAALEVLNHSLSDRIDRMTDITSTAQQAPLGVSAAPPVEDSVLAKATREAALIQDMTADLYQTFYRETVSLENTVSFALPFFPVEMITNLHDIRKTLIDYRGSLQDTLSVLSGANDQGIIVRAKQSALDFGLLINMITALAKGSAVTGDILDRMKAAVAMDRIGVKYQRDIAEKLVDVFIQARDYDAKSDQLRKSAMRSRK